MSFIIIARCMWCNAYQKWVSSMYTWVTIKFLVGGQLVFMAGQNVLNCAVINLSSRWSNQEEKVIPIQLENLPSVCPLIKPLRTADFCAHCRHMNIIVICVLWKDDSKINLIINNQLLKLNLLFSPSNSKTCSFSLCWRSDTTWYCESLMGRC